MSGSGLRFHASAPIAPGDQLELNFEIPAGAGCVHAVIEIVRKINTGIGPENEDVAGRFRAMSEASRSAVVRHVFELKRSLTPPALRRAG